jgi:5-methylcytosine-specific restriction endonuclease McrA
MERKMARYGKLIKNLEDRRCPICKWMMWSPQWGQKSVELGRPRERQATVDHIMARAYGGTNERSNLRVLCRKCNEAKGQWC